MKKTIKKTIKKRRSRSKINGMKKMKKRRR